MSISFPSSLWPKRGADCKGRHYHEEEGVGRMKPRETKIGNVLNGKSVSILTAIFLVATMFAVSVSDYEPAVDSMVSDDDIAEELDVNVESEVEEELEVEEEIEVEEELDIEDFEVSVGLPTEAFAELLDSEIEGGIEPTGSTDTMYGFHVYGLPISRGPVSFVLNNPGSINLIAASTSPDWLSGGTWTNDGKWIGCQYGNGALWEIDPSTGAMTSIGGGGSGLNGLAFNPINNKLYGASSTGSAGGLWEININDGSQTYIGDFVRTNWMIGIAFDANGVLYGWDISPDKLYTIDINIGLATEVGRLKLGATNINLNYAQDGAFDYDDDTLYLSAYLLSPGYGGQLLKCDEDTAVCELVGQFQSSAEIAASAIPYGTQITPPIADAGPDQTVNEGDEVLFDGSNSKPSQIPNGGGGPQTTTGTLVLGTDNNQHSGQGLGYVRRSRTSYYAYDSYYAYMYQSGTDYETHGWAVFDLSDLGQYNAVSILSGSVLWRHDRHYMVTQLDFWTMESIPYDNGPSEAKTWFNEVGGPGSVLLTSNTLSSSSSSNFDVTGPISPGGIAWLNSKLSSGDTDIAIAGDISKLYSGTYGYAYCYDVRLVLNFEFTGANPGTGQIAHGDDLSGYTYRTSTNYDIGRVYTSSTTYRGYAVWDPQLIKSTIPSDASITKISLRVNFYYGYLDKFSVYHMANNPRGSSASVIYPDAADGTKYFEAPYAPYTSNPVEREWDLGPAALSDFIDTLDGTPDFFALGFAQNRYCQFYSPRLVVQYKLESLVPQIIKFEWDFESDGTYDYVESLEPTASKTIQLGSDNPEYNGQGMGYSYRSGSYYNCYAGYYAYPYLRPGATFEYRGWATFDLADVKAWSGATAVDAKLLIHNYYRYYAKEIVFTALTTTPREYPGSATSKMIFDESSPTGTQIGQYTGTSTRDTTRHTIEVDLNANAVTAINARLGGSVNTFGVGMYVKSIHSGYSYGYARWTDIRLVVTFDYTSELTETQSGRGVAFGDDWSGRIYKYRTNPAYYYPDGYMYVRKYSYYEYRNFAQWEVQKIADVLPSGAEIKAVALRFNHQYSSQSSNYVYQMEYNVKTATPDQIFTDAADGTQYTGPHSVTSSDSEYTWDLGAGAVNDLQDALDNNIETFAVGLITTSTSGYSYNYGPRLVIEWKAPGGGALGGLARHTYGDNGVYTVTMRITDSLGMTDTDTCVVTVLNVVPAVVPIGPFTVNEGSPLTLSATATDPGSDDLTFYWELELGPAYTNIYYNDGVGPDPYPSPDGIFPVTVTDTIVHTYGDNGVYRLLLEVTDDDGDVAALTTTITVVNVAPAILPFGPITINEGSPLTISAVSIDPGSDDLTFEWELEMGPSATTTFYNDVTGPDPPKSPWGTFPIAVTDSISHTYGDNGVYSLKLTVTDDDGAVTVYTTTITVYNVNPTIAVKAYINVDFTLRVSGEKWHNVELYVLNDGSTIAYADVLRMPGDPDDQSITLLGVKCDVTSRIGLRVVYTPFDDVINGQINGADPAWVTIQFENGDEYTFDHTFNYQHPERWVWSFHINPYLVGQELTFEGHATDPGSDDLTFDWYWGDGSLNEGARYFNNGVSPDPAKSPDGVFPFSAHELRTHTYWTNANFPLRLTVTDDDGGTTVLVVIIIVI